MNDRASAPSLHVNIAAVERDTRLGKDTLRVWERRYGFPQPVRDANGERLYPMEQVEKLRVIKRLLDTGLRPGQVVALPLSDLLALGGGREPDAQLPDPVADAASLTEVERLMAVLRGHDPTLLRRAFTQALMRTGVSRFILEVAIPLTREVGAAWARGDLRIFEEHFYSEALETALRSALASAPEAASTTRPRVLLTTLPGEPHNLGLLMAEALLSVEGCACINLGRQTPLEELRMAAEAYSADIIAVSFSAAGHAHHAAEALAELRTILPETREIWVGSPHAALHRRGVPGVVLMSSLEQIAGEVQRWHETTA